LTVAVDRDLVCRWSSLYRPADEDRGVGIRDSDDAVVVEDDRVIGSSGGRPAALI
jgi:hypothetical protein